jgi:DNA-binding MarR family transcriptional regulator
LAIRALLSAGFLVNETMVRKPWADVNALLSRNIGLSLVLPASKVRRRGSFLEVANLHSFAVTGPCDEALALLGVSIAQFNLIRVIISMEPVSVTDLAAFVELERSTVGRNGRVLERLGLVKMSHGSDQREALFSLTEKGHEVLKRGLPLWDSVQHGIEENLGADKARQLQRLLASL